MATAAEMSDAVAPSAVAAAEAAESGTLDGDAYRRWRDALPVASLPEKRRENESPDLDRALVALPDYNMMAFLGRDPPGTLNHALNPAEAQAVCKALEARVEQEASWRRKVVEAGCPAQTRCALVLVAPAGAPPNPAKPYAPEMRWVEDGEEEKAEGDGKEKKDDEEMGNGSGEADVVRGWDDVVGMTAKYIQDCTDLTVHSMRCGPGEPGGWKLQLERPEVVLVALASDALAAFQAGELTLDRVHLLVYDAADRARDPRDPAGTLLQFALPSMEIERRPRVLALQRAQLENPGDFANVEASLGVRYIGSSGFSSRVTADNPRLDVEPTAVAPAHAPLTTVETLWYPRNGAPVSVSASESEKVHVEVGPFGAFLYNNMHKKRRLRRRIRKNLLASLRDDQEPPEDLDEYLSEKGVSTYMPFESTGGRDQLMGVSIKAMKLLDLLHTECAVMLSQQACMASPGGVSAGSSGGPSDDGAAPAAQPEGLSFNRSIVVYSGSSAVTAALCELIKQIPGFTGVRTEVVIGDRNGAQPWNSDEQSEPAKGWQGIESDDEVVRDFLGGQVHILFVASDNLAKITQRRHPIQLPGLVVCFDSKAQESVVQKTTLARRRIVVFAPANERRRDLDPVGTTVNAEGTVSGAPVPASPAGIGALDSLPASGVATGASATNGAYESHADGKVHYDAVVAEKVQRNVKMMPPTALLGPNDCGGETSFFYTISASVNPMSCEDRSGISSFVVVLSEQLDADDLIMRPGADDSWIGAGKSGDVVLILKLVGTGVLTAEQVQLGREFTSYFFRATSPRYESQLFQWGKNSPCKTDRTRRYLVLPRNSARGLDVSDAKVRVRTGDGVVTARKWLLNYFAVSDCAPSDNSETAADGSEVSAENSPDESVSAQDVGASVTGKHLNSHGTEKSPVVDWCTVQKQVETLNIAMKADRHELPDVEAFRNLTSDYSSEGRCNLEGKVVFAVYDSKRVPFVTGFLDHGVCPVSKFSRQKGFPLDSEGYLIDPDAARQELSPTLVDIDSIDPPRVAVHEDGSLANAAGVPLSEPQNAPSSRKRPRSTLDEVDQSMQELGEKDSDEQPMKKRTVGTASDGIDRNAAASSSVPAAAAVEPSCNPLGGACTGQKRVFDAARNKKKGRKSWFAPIVTTYAEHLAVSKNVVVRNLTQPLIAAVQPEPLPMSTLQRVVRGDSLEVVADAFVRSKVDGVDVGMHNFVPDFLEHYDIPVQALLMPAVLMLMERHLTSCAFRKKFATQMDRVISIPRLTCALTSSTVSAHGNYERLEFLGDSLLKLSSTVRLFVQHPHFSEGEMHPIRCHLVSNSTLNIKAQEHEIEHFLNFTKTSLADWSPPGYERDAQHLPLHDKALADVVEAVTGAFFLQGVADYAKADAGDVMNGSDSDAIRAEAVAQGIVCGYKSGSKFLEAIGALDSLEPSRDDILRSAIHAMLDPSDPAPEELKPSSFPRDERMVNPTRVWEEHVGRIEERLGYKFKHRQLLYCALTHSSYAEAVRGGSQILTKYQNFQRLEFLGDAVLDFCVAQHLFNRYPNQGPGDLTELKAAVVSNEAYARVAVENNMHHCLYTRSRVMRTEVEKFARAHRAERAQQVESGQSGWSEFWTSEREAPKVLGDVFEAAIGAVFVEAGLSTAWKVALQTLGPTLKERADPAKYATHPVKVLQDYVTKEQRLSAVAPKYHIPAEVGTRSTTANVYVHKKLVASGTGTSKKRAMCSAAKHALEVLKAAEAPSSPAHALIKNLRLLGDKERAELSKARRRPY